MDSLDLRIYAPFTKVSEEGGALLVETIVNDETVDDQGEILDYEAVKRASADYMKWAAVREMHGDHAAGTMLSLTHDDETRTTRGVLKIVDPGAIRKIKEGVYRGTSMGGRKLARVMQKIGATNVGRIVDLLWVETSLVDRPSRPTAALTIMKRSLTEEQMSKSMDPEAAKPEDAKTGEPIEKDAKADPPAPVEPQEQAKAEPPADPPAEAKEGDEADKTEDPKEGDEQTDLAKMATAFADLAKEIRAGFAKMAESKTEDPAPAPAEKPAEEPIEKAAKTEDKPAPGVDPEAVGAYLVERMVQSETLAKAADVQAMRDDLAEAIKPLQEEIAKIAAQPAAGGPLRYATDPRRPLEDAPEAKTGMSDALAKVASNTADPAVREEIGRMAASEEIRALQRG